MAQATAPLFNSTKLRHGGIFLAPFGLPPKMKGCYCHANSAPGSRSWPTFAPSLNPCGFGELPQSHKSPKAIVRTVSGAPTLK